MKTAHSIGDDETLTTIRPERGILILAATLIALAGMKANLWADYNPVAITAGSYTQDIVVEKTAQPPLLQGSSIPSTYQTNFVNVTMDGGTGLGGYTWNEIGFPGNSTAGLPHPGTTFTAASPASPVHQFMMASSYKGNCCLFVASGISGSLQPITPAKFTSLSILNTAGNGPVSINYTVSHADGSTESGNFSSLDWFNTTTPAYIANGRTYAPWLQAFTATGDCNLFASDIILANTNSAVTNIAFTFVNGGRSCIFALAGQATSGGSFSPISVTGFNADPVVELQNDRAYTTATMDTGTNNTGNTWYEAGYDSMAPTTGLPAAGSTITSTNLADHHYTLAPSYASNNAILIDTNHTSANIVPIFPTNYTSISMLTAGGNIVSGHIMTNVCIMQHADGTSETNLFLAYDWFESGQSSAFSANGRVSVNDTTLNTVNGVYPKLFESQFQLANTVSSVTNILIQYSSAPFANSTTYVLAVSATAGSVGPIIASSPASTNVLPSTTVVFTATVSGGTPPITNQWQIRTNGIWLNLTDGGNISGSATTALTISNSQVANSADYRFVAANIAGSVPSLPATLIVVSPLADVTSPGDPVADFGDVNVSPSGQDVTRAIDNLTTKYLNFGQSGGTNFVGPVGFVVTPSSGLSVVSGLRIYTADDNEVRDPANYALEGSTDGGATYAPISSNVLALPSGRNAGGAALNPLNQYLQQIIFNNTNSYSTYRLTFNDVKSDAAANSMQLGEIELLGTPAAILPPTVTTDIRPLQVTAFDGMLVTYTVGVSGTGPFYYQWESNSTPISSATNATFSFLVAAGTNTYFCRITNSGGPAFSSTATVTGIDATASGTSFAINAHDFADFGAYDGTNYTEYVLYFGQGAYSDTGNNLWNGFGGTFKTNLNLTASDGTLTPILLSVSDVTDNGSVWMFDDNAGNNSFQGAPGFLLGTAALANGGTTGTFTFTNMPDGNYDLYIYAANFDGDRGARLTVNGYTQTVNNDPAVTGLQPSSSFVNGVDYVVFHNLFPANSVITGTWDGNFTNPNTGQTGEGDLNGLQLVKLPVTQQPTLSIICSGGNVIVSWTPVVGQLQTSATPGGPYTNIPGATAPYTNALSQLLFYRVKVQ